MLLSTSAARPAADPVLVPAIRCFVQQTMCPRIQALQGCCTFNGQVWLDSTEHMACNVSLTIDINLE